MRIIKSAFPWSRQWTRLFWAWLLLSLAGFLAFEWQGLFVCERFGLPGCSTLSYWLAANPGPVFVGAATGAFAVVFTWHIFDCRWRHERRRVRWLVVIPVCVLEYVSFIAFVLILATYGVYP